MLSSSHTWSFADACLHVASALALSTPARLGWCTLRTLAPFDGCAPYTSNLVGSTRGALAEHRGAVPTDVAPTDLDRPIRYAALTGISDAPGYGAFAARAASWSELRGQRVPFLSRYHCVVSMAEIHAKGTYEGKQAFCSWHMRERRWLTWGSGIPAHSDGVFDTRMPLLIGAQFAARYEWHVLIGLPSAPRFALPCSAEEARELFAERDLPDGAVRRPALRHWVDEHYRRRHDSDALIYVRPHLRGASEFTFDALRCSVVPSAYDQERARAASHPD